MKLFAMYMPGSLIPRLFINSGPMNGTGNLLRPKMPENEGMRLAWYKMPSFAGLRASAKKSLLLQ